MNRLELSKFLFYAISITFFLGMSFVFGLYSGANRTVVCEAVIAFTNSVEKSLNLVSEEALTLSKIHPKHFLQPARYEGAGVTVNDVSNGEDELILLSGFFDKTNQLRLIRRDGTVIARWLVRFSKIFPDVSHILKPPKTDWNIDIHGALALPDGSVVFNFEYGGLVKLDYCGRIVWTLAHETHHSVEVAEGGGFWVPGRRSFPKESESPFPPFETPFVDDTIMRISDDGKIIKEISVAKLFYDNDLGALLTATGDEFLTGMLWDREIVHLNKIEELPTSISEDFDMLDPGDLILSIRKQNLVLIVNPNSGVIKWWRIGPWLRQHDPEFKKGGKLILFNNNSYRTSFGGDISNDTSHLSIPRSSNILEIDVNTGAHKIIYGSKTGQEMLSVLRGKLELTPNGGLLITEFEGGRVFEINSEGQVIWEYINRYDSDEVAEITEARIYPTNYFNVSDWSCE